MIKDFFMKKRSVFVLLMAVAATFMPVGAADWQQDVLGDGYVAKIISMADDYRGKVMSTVVKKQDNPATGKAVLYVHGYNDYFFQRELGDSVVAHGYGFYAVDLRKFTSRWTESFRGKEYERIFCRHRFRSECDGSGGI